MISKQLLLSFFLYICGERIPKVFLTFDIKIDLSCLLPQAPFIKQMRCRASVFFIKIESAGTCFRSYTRSIPLAFDDST